MHDPQVMARRQRVKVTTDPTVRSDEVFVTVMTKDGRSFVKDVEHAAGSLEKPLSNHDLEFKFRKLVEDVLPGSQVDKLLEMAWNLESLSDAGGMPRQGAMSSNGKGS